MGTCLSAGRNWRSSRSACRLRACIRRNAMTHGYGVVPSGGRAGDWKRAARTCGTSERAFRRAISQLRKLTDCCTTIELWYAANHSRTSHHRGRIFPRKTALRSSEGPQLPSLYIFMLSAWPVQLPVFLSSRILSSLRGTIPPALGFWIPHRAGHSRLLNVLLVPPSATTGRYGPPSLRAYTVDVNLAALHYYPMVTVVLARACVLI